jgi:hypothetical protein
MNEVDLRSEFRKALGEPNVPADFRHQARLAVRQPADKPQPRLQWVPGTIAAVLALAIIAGFFAVGEYRRSHTVPSHPQQTTTPTKAIPAGTPVVLYWRADDASLYAVSWSGDLYRAPKLKLQQTGIATQSPDGSRLAIGTALYDTVTGENRMLDIEPSVSVTWADDNRHVCLTRPLAGPGAASEISYAMPLNSSKVLGNFGSHGEQVPGATVLACSAKTSRVVVANVGGMGDTTDVWVLDAATGAIKYHRTYPTVSKYGNPYVGVAVVASPDGQFLAETYDATGSTSVRRVADDSVVTTLNHMEVHGFSSSGDLVLATPRQAEFLIVNNTTKDPALINWHTGQTVWQSPDGADYGGSLASQPNGTGVALSLRLKNRWDLWLVDASGHGRVVDQNVAFGRVTFVSKEPVISPAR